MNDLQIDWLRSFVAAVDAGSLSSAAPEVHRSQSAVSMQLKKLESAAGCSLLLRGPRQLQLTHEGQVLLGFARCMLDLQAEAQAALQGEEISGQVRLPTTDGREDLVALHAARGRTPHAAGPTAAELPDGLRTRVVGRSLAPAVRLWLQPRGDRTRRTRRLRAHRFRAAHYDRRLWP